MPHFGLIDEDKLGPDQSLLMRARLHIRGGRLRLQENKISLGIITLYDALCSALEWYISEPHNVKRLGIATDDLIKDEECIVNFLKRAEVLDDTFDFDEFNALVERALYEEITDVNWESLIRNIESIMTLLGVMPYDESLLPRVTEGTI